MAICRLASRVRATVPRGLRAAFALVCCFGLAAMPKLARATITDGLIFYVPFENFTPQDIIGGKSGGAGGASAAGSGGIIGNFVHLTNDTVLPETYLYWEDPTPATNNFTVQVWIRSTSLQNGQASVDPAIIANKNWGSGANAGWVVALGSSTGALGRLQWNFRAPPAARADFDPTAANTTVQDGAWHHLIVTHDRSGFATFYVDGVDVGAVNIAPGAGNSVLAGVPGIFALANDMTLYYENGNGTTANGDFDELAMWNRALFPSEVTRIYSAGRSGIGILNVPEPTTPFVAEVSPIDGASEYSPEGIFRAVIVDASTQLNPASVKVYLDGSLVTHARQGVSGTNIITFTPTTLLGPQSAHEYRLEFRDNGSPAVARTNRYTFTIANYLSLLLPTPMVLETFDEVPESGLPTGWSVTNATTIQTPGLDLNDPNSDSYLDWVVVNSNRFANVFDQRRLNIALTATNGRLVKSLISGNLAYAESDNRGGNQVQVLFSPDYDLTGKTDVYLSFHNVYEQNQDSAGSVEYSIDQGATWLPALYMLDEPDVIRDGSGVIDAVATLNTARGDQAYGQSYGAFIGAVVSQALAPFISVRVNDDARESKRVEFLRLAQADNQPKVRLRFAQSGTGSWYFGIDNVGLYSVAPTVVTGLVPGSAAIGSSITITGSNFGPVGSNNVVYFGTVRGTVTSATSTQLVVTVPAGAAYAPVSVTVDGLTGSSRLPFGVSFASGGPIGTNLFAPPVTFLPLPQYSDRHAAGDIDGDGRNDLVVSYHSEAGTSTVRVFTNRASPGSFTTGSLGNGFVVDSGRGLTSIVDLDGDGKLDLVAYRYITGVPLRTEWEVHRNTSSPGALAFTKSVLLPANSMFLDLIGIGDLDGDGRRDLLGKSTNNIFFALRNASVPGSVIFEAPVPLIASCGILADNAHFADLDGDGKLDILLGGGNGCPIEIFRSLATPGTLNTNSFARPFALPFAPGRHPLAIADYDGDGKLDIAALGDCENIVRVYRNVSAPGALGTNSFAPPVSFAAGGWPHALLTTDLDGDGRPDIVTAGCATNDLYCGAICGTNFFSVLENISVPGAISSNSFAAPVTFSAGSRGAFPLASDMDGDGRPDLIVRTYFGYFSVWRNTMPALPLGAPSILVNGTVRVGQSVTVTNGAVVEIQTAFTGGSIYFTLDGSDPANGQSYTGPFMLTETAIIRAVAYTADFSDFAAAEPITVSLVRSPFIAADPQSQTVAAGSIVEFEAAAGGDAPLTYQWRRNGVAIPGATSSSLILVNVQSVVAGNYSVVVANAYGSVTGAAAALTIIQPPAVESQPASLSVGLNDAAVFCVTASGDPPLRYQWRKNGVNIPGATNQCFAIEHVQVSDGGRYSVVVENDVDALVSAPAQLTVNLITVPGGDAFADAIEILEHCFLGSNVGATSQPGEPRHAGKIGGRSIWYTWFASTNGIATFETTGSSFDTLLAVYTGSDVTALTPIAADEDDGGFLNSRVRFNAVTNVEYRIVVDGYAGNQGTYSICWTLEATPVPLPVIITQPTNQTVRETQPVNFSVVATSAVPNIKYQWFFNGAPMPGKTNAVLDIPSVLPQDVGYYRVGVSNRVGVSTVFVGLLSDTAILEIGPVPGVQSVDKLPDLFSPPPAPAPSRPGPSGLAAATTAPGVPLSVSAGSTDSQVINNTGSATSPTEPLPCRVLGGASRWLWLVPTETATLRIDTIGSTIDTVLGIFTGTDAASIVPLPNGCNDNGAPDGVRSLVQFTAQAGVGYYIQADGKSGTSGIIRINWALGTAPSSAQTQVQYVVRQGDSLVLTSTATGIPGPLFQWRRNNGVIANATNPSLPLVNIQPSHGGTYSVIGSNFIGMITSVVATITVQSNAFAAAQDSFDSTHLAWVASAGATVSYQAAGGNPGGYLRFQPGPSGGELEAPAEYLGNKFYCYNGLLSFDLRRATSVHVNVVLAGGGFELALELPTATGTGWTSYKLLLHESAAWRNDTGQPPTREEFLALLGALDGLYLEADGPIEVDNLEFLAPTTPVLSLGAATGEWLVQWPIAIGSYTVEAASALDGSAWAPVAATLVSANGLNSMRLPAIAGQRFFRLHKN